VYLSGRMLKHNMGLAESKKAFTLIELLVVLAIIVILISASLIGLSGSKESARDAKRKADLEAIRGALEIYKADSNVYPSGLTCESSKGSCSSACPCSGSDWGGNISSVLEPDYIANLPVDLINDNTYYFYYKPVCSTTLTICGVSKVCPSNCCAYELGAKLESTGSWYTVCSP
jgi:prepilin-type N-terminal cleavage/methylation domain-containing protein